MAFEARRVTVRHAVAHLGEQRRGKRDAQDAVGELVPHPRIAHGRGAVGRDVQGTRVHERERDEVDGRAEDGGKREPQRLVQALVVQVDMEAEPESCLDERGYLYACHHGDGKCRADGEQQQAGLPARGVHEGIGEEGRDDDEVHEHRADRRPEVLALGVEQSAEDRAHAIEDDLEGEEAEEPNGVFDRLARARAEQRLREHDLRREDRGEQRDDAEEDQREREQVRCVAIALIARAHVALLQVDG